METIDDILCDIRRRNYGCPLDAEASHSTVEDILYLADRIEAAHERELIAAKAKAAGEGYAAGKLSARSLGDN